MDATHPTPDLEHFDDRRCASLIVVAHPRRARLAFRILSAFCTRIRNCRIVTSARIAGAVPGRGLPASVLVVSEDLLATMAESGMRSGRLAGVIEFRSPYLFAVDHTLERLCGRHGVWFTHRLGDACATLVRLAKLSRRSELDR